MALDPRINEAIRQAVSESGQPAPLADKIIAWMQALAEGNEQLDSRDQVARRVEALYEAADLEADEDDATGGAAWR